MSKQGSQSNLSRAIITRAIEIGASAAGVVKHEALQGVTPADQLDSSWPARTQALVVLTLTHPEEEPGLDYWGVPGGTVGNSRMGQMLRELSEWLRDAHGLDSRPLGYQVDPNGVMLKDAAALAGLGVIGENNLLVTERLGPRVRLRALSLMSGGESVETTAQAGFRPCDGCSGPCHDACPQDAFVDGRYQRERCSGQMAIDESQRLATVVDTPDGQRALSLVRYCRACELACPVGQGS